jgi:hypothetical protein
MALTDLSRAHAISQRLSPKMRMSGLREIKRGAGE